MARRTKRPPITRTLSLELLTRSCSTCGGTLWAGYDTARTITTLEHVTRLTLSVRRCHNPTCPRYRLPIRPEEEGAWALPNGEFGLDVIALIGTLRYREHRSVPEIHRSLQERQVAIAQRTVTYLLERYEELLALRLADQTRLKDCLRQQGHVVLAIDGLQPFKTQDMLWVVRDTLSGEVLLARNLESARQDDLADLLREVKDALPVPIHGVVSDAQRPVRLAVQKALPGIPHQLCQFHYLKEAAKPIVDADHHAKTELKKYVKGMREIERSIVTREDQQAKAIRGYCLAVRSALADEGKPPLQLPGLLMHNRLTTIVASLERVTEKGLPSELGRLREVVAAGLFVTEQFWSPLQRAQQWLQRAAQILANEDGADAATVEERYRGLLGEVIMEQSSEPLAAWATHMYRVSRSYWQGLFHCYADDELPRTNNELEQYFGKARHHERRATGHKRPTSAVVVRGSVRVVAAVATQVRVWEADALRPGSIAAWRKLRAKLEARHEGRRAARRFRRDPAIYLAKLENTLLP